MTGPDERLEALRGQPGVLLVVDVQRSFADPRYLAHLAEADLHRVAAAVEATAAAVETARRCGVPVVWTRLQVPPQDVWPASNWFRGIGEDDPWPNEWEPCVEGTPGIEWYGVAPAAGEAVVAKRTYDAFHGTALADVLAEAGAEWVAVAGLTSECCVLTTAGSAFTRGFPVVVVGEATTAHELAVHEAALLVLALTCAVVAPLDDVAGVWAQTSGAGNA